MKAKVFFLSCYLRNTQYMCIYVLDPEWLKCLRATNDAVCLIHISYFPPIVPLYTLYQHGNAKHRLAARNQRFETFVMYQGRIHGVSPLDSECIFLRGIGLVASDGRCCSCLLTLSATGTINSHLDLHFCVT